MNASEQLDADLLATMQQLALKTDAPILSLQYRAGREQLVRPESEHVCIPRGYRAALSFEQQPSGLFRHLSVSVDTPGRLPHPEAIAALAREFGFTDFPPTVGRTWMEEFDPGHHAINVVELVMPVGGHA